ncbi:Transcription factor iws1 [Malassezia nana]|uniref:Transcription factor iws1 n=1 Tax=Malassezia nana TaxID=180528 RepID=A0AAF0J1Z7_9BASI|nr:Transcription factor iws1 [Malassezia nana]
MAAEDSEHRDIFADSDDEEIEQEVPVSQSDHVPAAATDSAELPSIPRREVDAETLASEPAPKKRAVSNADDDAEAVVPDADEDDDETAPQLSGKELIRAQVDARIDAALKSGKRRTNRRRMQGEDDLDMMADEEVSALRTEMMLAADEDEEANRYKQPATSKLRLLPRVVSTLQKTHLQQSIMDNNLLEGVKRWLEPLPDRSLPALNIQKELFGVLESMSIDTISLKMSGLGRVVVFYSLCKRVEPSIRRIAEQLIESWTRPVLKRSASYRDRHVAQAEWHQNSPQNLSNHLSEAVYATDKTRRHVGIPQAVTTGFQVAPKNKVAGSSNDHDHQTRLANHQRCVACH